jgi:hypothetical protein
MTITLDLNGQSQDREAIWNRVIGLLNTNANEKQIHNERIVVKYKTGVNSIEYALKIRNIYIGYNINGVLTYPDYPKGDNFLIDFYGKKTGREQSEQDKYLALAVGVIVSEAARFQPVRLWIEHHLPAQGNRSFYEIKELVNRWDDIQKWRGGERNRVITNHDVRTYIDRKQNGNYILPVNIRESISKLLPS